MSEFLTSEIVQKELQDIQILYNRLSNIVEHLRDLGEEEKVEFLEQTKILIEKQQIFHTRLSLTAKQDGQIREIVDNMNKLSVVFCGAPMSEVLRTMSDKLDSYLESLTPPK